MNRDLLGCLGYRWEQGLSSALCWQQPSAVTASKSSPSPGPFYGCGASCKVRETLSTGKSKSPKASRRSFPAEPKVGTLHAAVCSPPPRMFRFPEKEELGAFPELNHPQVTGLGSEASGRIRLHRPLPAPPRKALTRLGLVPPASHRPPAVGLPAADQGQSFQGLCSQSKGPGRQSTKNFDKGQESPCEPRELGCTVQTAKGTKKKLRQ